MPQDLEGWKARGCLKRDPREGERREYSSDTYDCLGVKVCPWRLHYI